MPLLRAGAGAGTSRCLFRPRCRTRQREPSNGGIGSGGRDDASCRVVHDYVHALTKPSSVGRGQLLHNGSIFQGEGQDPPVVASGENYIRCEIDGSDESSVWRGRNRDSTLHRVKHLKLATQHADSTDAQAVGEVQGGGTSRESTVPQQGARGRVVHRQPRRPVRGGVRVRHGETVGGEMTVNGPPRPRASAARHLGGRREAGVDGRRLGEPVDALPEHDGAVGGAGGEVQSGAAGGVEAFLALLRVLVVARRLAQDAETPHGTPVLHQLAQAACVLFVRFVLGAAAAHVAGQPPHRDLPVQRTRDDLVLAARYRHNGRRVTPQRRQRLLALLPLQDPPCVPQLHDVVVAARHHKRSLAPRPAPHRRKVPPHARLELPRPGARRLRRRRRRERGAAARLPARDGRRRRRLLRLHVHQPRRRRRPGRRRRRKTALALPRACRACRGGGLALLVRCHLRVRRRRVPVADRRRRRHGDARRHATRLHDIVQHRLLVDRDPRRQLLRDARRSGRCVHVRVPRRRRRRHRCGRGGGGRGRGGDGGGGAACCVGLAVGDERVVRQRQVLFGGGRRGGRGGVGVVDVGDLERAGAHALHALTVRERSDHRLQLLDPAFLHQLRRLRLPEAPLQLFDARAQKRLLILPDLTLLVEPAPLTLQPGYHARVAVVGNVLHPVA
eukprot:Rhum_TRINITY_DN14548_c17_g2::Rhum_TRINITY_DN14548_c17_g2_i1::g.97429::m.97429